MVDMYVNQIPINKRGGFTDPVDILNYVVSQQIKGIQKVLNKNKKSKKRNLCVE